MSSLWTPGGEVPVEREGTSAEPPPPAPGAAGAIPGADDLDPEEARQLAAQMAEVRRQILEAPPEVVVNNHVMGLYELAAIHLSADPPNLVASRLPIDAMAAVLSACEGRLGEDENALRDALTQLQQAYVALRDRQPPESDTGAASG